ncbi:glycine, alanine and asparagine-rich protein-like [Aplysia californica]|uniref:Glycine, alanine and asparagine-rich protein-like n=1 Tax=Aplysia californica TaxID=6500 RepID=A0ABM1W1Z7_APLCA|nr:glycine, alanine and asparagine-rich protein-like [Aplysia californica]
MVEECVVNKAGKSKCKIKIDNSSVILLNDKSDFPRLSPRPSLLNLVDRGGRRKSMQPQCLSSIDRELYLKESAKDTSKKGLFKTRARSNSESGRGTLSSPDEGPGLLGGMGDGGVSGLSTPVVIDRKSSLNSPMIANHVRNILNSLEEKGGAGMMGGGGGGSTSHVNGGYPTRFGRGRGSMDSDPGSSLAEVTIDYNRRRSYDDRMVASTSSINGSKVNGKRRGSLQPQKRVDEGDEDVGFSPENVLLIPTIAEASTRSEEKISEASRPSSLVRDKTPESAATSLLPASPAAPAQRPPVLIAPTMIQIQPPSTTVTPSTSPSPSGSNYVTSKMASFEPFNVSSEDTGSSTPTAASSPTLNGSNVQERSGRGGGERSVGDSSGGNGGGHGGGDGGGGHGVSESGEKRDGNNAAGGSPTFRPKTLRTPSDIENENNLTQSEETSDGCASRSVDDECVTRNTSVDDVDDELLGDAMTDNDVVTITSEDQVVVSGDTTSRPLFTSDNHLTGASKTPHGLSISNGGPSSSSSQTSANHKTAIPEGGLANNAVPPRAKPRSPPSLHDDVIRHGNSLSDSLPSVDEDEFQSSSASNLLS